jgi:hypothetical protein
VTVVRVYVGTTEGPAEIQRITEEPVGIRSVVCLDGKAVALPISADYDSFVRRPTGVVERLYGHSAYRMDVGARITDGLSWQLGVLIAHALHASGRLATGTHPADAVVWATGEIDAALLVRSVDSVPRKLHTSADLLRGLAATRTPILVLVPRDAETAARTALVELEVAQACSLITLATAAQAFAALDLAGAPATRPRGQPRSTRTRERWLWTTVALPILGAVAAVLALAAAWREPLASWMRLADAGELPKLEEALATTEATPNCATCATVVALYRSRLSAERPVQSAIRVEAVEIRGRPFADCLDVVAQAGTPTTQPVARLPDGAFATSSAGGLCAVRYAVSGARFVGLIVSTHHTAFQRPALQTATGADRTQIEVRVPNWLSSPVENRLIVLAAAKPLEPLIATVARNISGSDLPTLAALEQIAGPAVLAFDVEHTISR